MTRPRRLLAAVAGATALTTLLAACATGSAEPDAADRATTAAAPGATSSPAEAARAGTVEGWRRGTPAEVGLRPKRLRTLAREAKAKNSSCYAVVRRNRLVLERNWGVDRAFPREVFSVTKSVTSTLVGIAQRQGLLHVDDPVGDYVEEWQGTDSAGVTIRHLLSNDSGRAWSMESDYRDLVGANDRTAYAVGLAQQHPPGSAWAYNNAAIQVLDRVLSIATGGTTADFAQAELFEPLGMTHSRLTADPSGHSTNTFYGMQTTCLDLARFARLHLLKGRVGTTRLVSEAWVRRATATSSTELNAAYGWLWWVNREGRLRGATDAVDAQGQPLEEHTGRLVPGAPQSMYAALGLFGQTAMVDPRSRTLVVRIGGTAGSAGDYGLAEAARVVTWASR